MSVLIKGMEIPQNCSECKLLCNENFEIWCCLTDREDVFLDATPDWCPLVEVPEPHGRLIDADATMKQWGLNNATKYGNKTAEQQHFSYSTMMMYEIADILDDAPVVIEAEGE